MMFFDTVRVWLAMSLSLPFAATTVSAFVPSRRVAWGWKLPVSGNNFDVDDDMKRRQRSFLEGDSPGPSYPTVMRNQTMASASASTSASSSRRGNVAPIDEFSPNVAPLADLVKLPDDYRLITPSSCRLPALKPGQRLVCIGDVHGDFSAFKEFLTIAGVYEEDPRDANGGRWIGGDTVLVQTGDVLDRGMQELVCWRLLCRLSQQASQVGGTVVALYGNHEAMNAAAQFQYAMGEFEYEHRIGRAVDESLSSPAWRTQFSRHQPSRWATYEPGGILARPLLSQLKVAVQVGRTVCVHAGLTLRHLETFRSRRPGASPLDGMSEAAQHWILNCGPGEELRNNFGVYQTPRDAKVAAEVRFNSSISTMPECLGGTMDSQFSPVWMRDYSAPPNQPVASDQARARLGEVLQFLRADRMVVGHTVQQRINGAVPDRHGEDAQVWRIDVGASRGILGQPPEVLEISQQGSREVVTILTRNGPVPASERVVGMMEPSNSRNANGVYGNQRPYA